MFIQFKFYILNFSQFMLIFKKILLFIFLKKSLVQKI